MKLINNNIKIVTQSIYSFNIISLNSYKDKTPSPFLSTSSINLVHVSDGILFPAPNMCFNSSTVIAPLLSLSIALNAYSKISYYNNFCLLIVAAINSE